MLLDARAPWRAGPSSPPRRLLHLVLVWYWKEPWRCGEVAVVVEKKVLGRGSKRSIEWVRQRPGRNLPRPPLDDARISRLQLELEPTPEGLLVVNRGRCALFHDGVQVERTTARPGAVLTLRDVAVFLIEQRPEALPHCVHYAGDDEFEFGAADPHGLIGESEAAWLLRDRLAAAAAGHGHVLVHGPSGSGKELAAHVVHALSPRADRPKVTRNAATIPESLLDAELFGNARNYPNPGMAERAGLVGEAHGGVLVLDEVGELPAHHQAHLLRVLDRSGDYQRLGESRQRTSDFRLIGITNRDPSTLKHDFLARFVQRVAVPGLDQRRSDVTLALRATFHELLRSEPALAQRFQAAPRQREPLVEPRLIEALVRLEYTHHFRQVARLFQLALRSSSGSYVAWTKAVEREAVIERETAGEGDGVEKRTEAVDGPRAQARADVRAPASGETLDRHALRAALEASNGRPTEAARRLGLRNRFALYRLMQRYGIEKPAAPDGGTRGTGEGDDSPH